MWAGSREGSVTLAALRDEARAGSARSFPLVGAGWARGLGRLGRQAAVPTQEDWGRALAPASSLSHSERAPYPLVRALMPVYTAE